ncbi:hypothetical protein M8C21_023095 [Ambrosia artemisiifolia]|uniref:Diphosphomevalonate decarboxylase n=1 Tax=Ambrosia artemisiifolia TaxID=4212 RepID=A0AAD5G7L1_AMBAR|nr:hypothetical protein M8C21_023095 [Ambrosia artemisiifolia]
MGGEQEKWILMVTARTPTNIAVIKYWGKRDETLILPINDSISVTLDPSHLCTTTTVSVSPTFDQDRMQGSGSACRSLYGGFVKWDMGKEDNGSDSLAIQLADEKHWEELVIIIAVVSARQKETSSTSGMRDTVETSALIQHRAKEVVPKRVVQMEDAIQKRDFPSFARLACTDSNQIISCVEKWNRAEGTPQVAYTFDAGPNAVMIARNRQTAALLLQRLLYNFPPQSDTDLDSYIIGDKSILKDAGIKDMKDVEALTPPPEVKDNIPPAQKSKGDVSYFICTRPGGGPVVLSDETQALLDPLTGLPK